ncbi:hypothetical protein N658DRAFT_560293 [Parathielavia hyrcaniae]|uniref:Uncharacterized protein n=1 Tax=Parathielavia hyrcaniae TaxID=113614 RepID=A0AAN6T0B2_9PEZI|nr:hypothetical protein N658DRAFT_560293 [Parathielavia hyrcaniae]
MHFSRQQGAAVARPAQQPVQRGSTQQSRTATKNNPQRAVPGPGGERVQMTEPQEHPVKKTVWNRVLTGATKAAKPANWKHPGRAVKRFIPHAAKVGKDSSGFNLSYYRNTFFLLNNQMQFDLYMAGLAPKMTKREVDKLRASALRIRRKYKPETVMYDAHISPSGYEAPLKDVVAEAKAAKLRAVVAAQKKKQQQAASEDALPAFPTPASYTKIQVQHASDSNIRNKTSRPAHVLHEQQQQRPTQQGNLGISKTKPYYTHSHGFSREGVQLWFRGRGKAQGSGW